MKSVWVWSVAIPEEFLSRSNSSEYQPMWYSAFARFSSRSVGYQAKPGVPREECMAHSFSPSSVTGKSRKPKLVM